MSPRSRSRSRPNATDTYECSGRRDHGTDFCPQRPIPREPIDRAILEQFKLIGLDMEATKREYAEATAHQLQHARDALAQAERAEQHAAEAIERVQRDYARGALSAESFEGTRPQFVAEHEGATAEVERLRAHEHAIANATKLDDAEEAVLRWLAELREVIAGKVRNAKSVETLRNALTRLFGCFELNPDPKASMQIVPVLREDALVSDDPVLDADTPAHVPDRHPRATSDTHWLKFDSAISCAASSAVDTFHRDPERRIGARNLDGTNDGRPPDAARSPSPRPIEFAAAEHGSGPRVKPKCYEAR